MDRQTHRHDTNHRGLVPTNQLGTGTANGSTLLRGDQTWRLDKLNATVAPAVTDDSGDGYTIGSRWLDLTNEKEYVALDVSVGAAVWMEIGSGGGGGGSFTGVPETPSGTIDGANDDFTLSAVPTDGIILFKNGLYQREGSGNDYTLAADVITYEAGNIPQVGDSHVAFMLAPSGGGSAIEVFDEGGSLTAALASLDFVGPGVTATTSGDDVTVTIPGGSTLDLYGDGQDGDVVINSGSFSLSIGGSPVITNNALVRDAYFHDLELNGGDLNMAAFKLFVSGELKLTSGNVKSNGANTGNGGNGSAGAGGTQGAGGGGTGAGTTAAAQAGISGGVGGFNANGGNPAASGTITIGRTIQPNGAAGGASGQGQTGGFTNSPAVQNTNTDRSVWTNPLRAISFRNHNNTAPALNNFLGSSNAGGGGAGSPSSGGGGGGASGACGGVVVVVAHTVTGTTDIQAIGGTGGNGGNGGGANAGGGAGGNGGTGGWIVFVYHDKSGWSGSLDVSGGSPGTGGTGVGTGSSGGNGSTGGVGIAKEWQL